MKVTFINSILAILLGYISFIAPAQVSSTWVEKGPFGKIPYVNGTQVQGNGLINCVETDPVDPNILYIGSPGGIWRSIDAGKNWSLFAGNKEFINTVSVGNIVVSKTNRNVIFVSTGNSKVSGCPTCWLDQSTSGIYRGVISAGTTVTWQNISSGLPSMNSIYTTAGDKGYKILKLKQCPFNSDILFAGTERGLYRCLNANSDKPTWQLININGVSVNVVHSIEYTKASVSGNFSLYVTGDSLAFKTSDLVSWTNLIGPSCTNCLSLTGSFLTNLNNASSVQFYTLQVIPSNKHDNRMYIGLLTKGNGRNYRYIYSHEVNTWNMLSEPAGWRESYSSGQPPIMASIYNPTLSQNEVIAIGSECIEGVIENNIPVNGPGTYAVFRNSDISYWTQYVKDSHADIRGIKTSSDNRWIYCANDGFLSKFDAFNSDLNSTSCWMSMQNNNVSLGRSYFISTSATSSDFLATGFHDNGTMFYKAGQGWKAIQVGDGLDEIIQGDNIYACVPGMQHTIYYGPNYTQGSSSANFIVGQDGHTWQYRKIYKDPVDPSKVYILKYGSLSRIVNGDIGNPTLLKDFGNTDGIWKNPSALAVSNIDNNVMYVAFTEPNWVGWNGGPIILYTSTGQTPLTTWQSLAIPADNAKDKIRSMAVSSADPNTVYVACSKAFISTATTNPRARVLVSKNGGALTDYNSSRTSIDPRYEVYCVLFENGSNEGVYAGTDNGVYYTNKTMTSWIRYDVGLPNVPVTEMVYHPKDNVILASTWGRGVWQVYPYCIAAGNVTINSTNFNTYKNTPTQVNGTITFSANIASQTPKSIYELRATNDISFLAGTSFTALNNTSRLLAYITPCGRGGSGPYYRMAESSSDEDTSRSVENNLINEKMKIYPNPIQNGKTTLHLSNYYDKQLTIVIYDMNGVQIKSLKNDLESKELEIDLTNQMPGMYLINVISGKLLIYTDKIVIVGTTEGDVNSSPNNKSNISPNTKSKRIIKL